MTADNDDKPAGTDHDALFETIAREMLGIETLATRNSDRLDFHDLAVWSIAAALNRAFVAGYQQAVIDRGGSGDDHASSESDESNLVPPAFACPQCGERDMDQLICDENGEDIACRSCGTNYIITQLG